MGHLSPVRGVTFTPDDRWVVSASSDGTARLWPTGTVTAVTEEGVAPARFHLGLSDPNPFNGTTLIRYETPRDTHVRMAVYNVLGQRVRLLVDESMTSGQHTARWDGTNDAGRQLASGVYLYRLESLGRAANRKVLLLR